jgi:HEAT repeat protein
VSSLGRALKSPKDGLALAAATCLGEIGDRRAVPALLPALDDGIRRGRTEVSCEIIRTLARLNDSEAVPKLVSILDRKSLLRRNHHRELQLAALLALDQLPGSEARRGVFRSLHSRDRTLRECAEELAATREDAVERSTEQPARTRGD